MPDAWLMLRMAPPFVVPEFRLTAPVPVIVLVPLTAATPKLSVPPSLMARTPGVVTLPTPAVAVAVKLRATPLLTDRVPFVMVRDPATAGVIATLWLRLSPPLPLNVSLLTDAGRPDPL